MVNPMPAEKIAIAEKTSIRMGRPRLGGLGFVFVSAEFGVDDKGSCVIAGSVLLSARAQA
jgi:hypothetical protein